MLGREGGSKIDKRLKDIQDELAKVIMGKPQVIHKMLVALLSKGHVLIDDVPGVGKTVLAKSLAKLLGGRFQRIQFTPDLMPRDVVGTHIFNPATRNFELHKGPVHTHILLADEINRATPRTQSALLEAMSEGQVTIEGNTIPLPQPFMVMATQNPVEQQGTFPLPEAQLDRFMMKLGMGYPDLNAELEMLDVHGGHNPGDNIVSVMDPETILAAQQEVDVLEMTTDVKLYLLQLIRATREKPEISLGASPRSALALMRASKAEAYLQGRSYVTPQDVRELFPHVISHRILLIAEARLKGISPTEVVMEVLDSVTVPVELEK